MMATSDSPVADEDVASRIQNSEAVQAPNNDVEMAQLPAQNAISPSTAASPDAVATLHDQGEVVDPPASLDPPQDTESPRPTPLVRSETAEFALGPDGAALPPQLADSPEPVLRITLMLTTGARHPYSISKKYLAARKVQATDAEGNFDPREMSAYKLKELIWTDWRPEWEPRPRDPAAIRLIILGRMLEDKSQLKGAWRFPSIHCLTIAIRLC